MMRHEYESLQLHVLSVQNRFVKLTKDSIILPQPNETIQQWNSSASNTRTTDNFSPTLKKQIC